MIPSPLAPNCRPSQRAHCSGWPAGRACGSRRGGSLHTTNKASRSDGAWRGLRDCQGRARANPRDPPPYPRCPRCPRSPRSPRAPEGSEGQPMTHRREVRCGPIGLSRLGPSPTGAVGRRPWISEVAGFCRCSNSPNEFRNPRKRGEQRRSNGFAIGGHLACPWAGDSSVGRPIIHSSKRATGSKSRLDRSPLREETYP